MTGWEIIQRAMQEGRFTELEPARQGNPLTPVRCIHLTSDERAVLDAQNNSVEHGGARRDTYCHKEDTPARKA